MTNIFEYKNFREYLRDYFKEAKKENPSFSHRYLAEKLGLATPNLILLVMQGKRNLTNTICFKLSQALNHSKKEARYFENMVLFAQAKTHDEKNKHFTAMLEDKRRLKIGKIEKQQYEYYSNWYNPVIRELVTWPGFNGDCKKLARRLSPPITPQQARKSVELLLDLGFIKKKGQGYVQSEPLISTGPEVNSVAVVNFHKKTALLAAESFDRHRKKERTITSCTINVSEEHFNEMKKLIADFRKSALELAEDAGTSSRVYQLNVQLFPLSATRETEQ